MSNPSPQASTPQVEFSRVVDAYDHWAEMAVDTFNRQGEVKACLVSLNFLSDGGFDLTFIDAAYVAEMVKTLEGQIELRKFTLGLLDDEKMRADMASKGFKPADAVVFITEIELKSANGFSVPNKEGILVVVHVPNAIYRGVNPIHSTPTRHATVGPMTLDPSPRAVSSALAPLVSPVVSEVLASRQSHDIHHTPSKTQ